MLLLSLLLRLGLLLYLFRRAITLLPLLILRSGLFLLLPGVLLALLFRRVVVLLLPLLILLRAGLFLLFRGVVLPLLFRRVITLLPLLILLSFRLLVLFRFCGLVLHLPFWIGLFLRFRRLGFFPLFVLPRVRRKTDPEQ